MLKVGDRLVIHYRYDPVDVPGSYPRCLGADRKRNDQQPERDDLGQRESSVVNGHSFSWQKRQDLPKVD